ncbi:MAG: hypothetical protein ABIJ95_05965 [Pseudomonadota bacterium]
MSQEDRIRIVRDVSLTDAIALAKEAARGGYATMSPGQVIQDAYTRLLKIRGDIEGIPFSHKE